MISRNLNILVFLLLAFFPVLVFAGPGDPPALYEEICEIRQMFCGGAAVAFVTIVVISVGVMAFMGKLPWTVVMVLATGMVIFLSAESVMESIFTPPPGSDVISKCSCE